MWLSYGCNLGLSDAKASLIPPLYLSLALRNSKLGRGINQKINSVKSAVTEVRTGCSVTRDTHLRPEEEGPKKESS